MKIKSLLAAVSMVAITAGSANALVLTNTTSGGTLTPALELETPITPAADFGDFAFNVSPNGTDRFPGGANLVIGVTLPTGVVFTRDITGGDIGGVASSATVQNGSGQAGTSSVEFLAAIFATAGSGAPLTFNFPLSLADCPTGSLTVTVATEEGTPIEEGTVTADATNAVFAGCESAVDGVVTSDEATSDTTITLASGYTALAEFDPSGTPISSPIILGAINYEIDPLVSVSRTGTAAGQPLVAADVDAITFDMVFEDASAITAASVGQNNGTASFGVKMGNLFRFNITDPNRIAEMLDGTADNFRVTFDGTTVIPTQTVSIGNSSVSFRDTGLPDLIMSEPGATGPLDSLQRQGREFGYFDWNAGPAISSPTLSVYRITGLTAGDTVDYSLTLENSNANGTYSGAVTADSAGEAVLVSTTMPVPATVGRFDVLINLETPNTDVDIDRMMLKGGVVSAFNDGANNDQEDVLEPNLNDDDN